MAACALARSFSACSLACCSRCAWLRIVSTWSRAREREQGSEDRQQQHSGSPWCRGTARSSGTAQHHRGMGGSARLGLPCGSCGPARSAWCCDRAAAGKESTACSASSTRSAAVGQQMHGGRRAAADAAGMSAACGLHAHLCAAQPCTCKQLKSRASACAHLHLVLPDAPQRSRLCRLFLRRRLGRRCRGPRCRRRALIQPHPLGCMLDLCPGKQGQAVQVFGWIGMGGGGMHQPLRVPRQPCQRARAAAAAVAAAEVAAAGATLHPRLLLRLTSRSGTASWMYSERSERPVRYSCKSCGAAAKATPGSRVGGSGGGAAGTQQAAAALLAHLLARRQVGACRHQGTKAAGA